MIHYYYGDGKGKTSAAMGAALRAAGAGWQVLILQLLKGTSSSECALLSSLPGVEYHNTKENLPFLSRMSEAERACLAKRQNEELDYAAGWLGAHPSPAMLILDEIGDALEENVLDTKKLQAVLTRFGASHELILTGHAPLPDLGVEIDYCTRFEALKHPYQKETVARKGIEY